MNPARRTTPEVENSRTTPYQKGVPEKGQTASRFTTSVQRRNTAKQAHKILSRLRGLDVPEARSVDRPLYELSVVALLLRKTRPKEGWSASEGGETLRTRKCRRCHGSCPTRANNTRQQQQAKAFACLPLRSPSSALLGLPRRAPQRPRSPDHHDKKNTITAATLGQKAGTLRCMNTTITLR